jgi:putative transposase
VLGVRLVHSRPYRPQGRGKQERLNSYIKGSFVAEMEQRGIASFEELNDFFVAWAEQVANRRCHAETHEAPIERWAAAGFAPTYPSSARLHEAFRWSVVRRVSKTAMISFQANRYAVDPALVGKVVELRFDPEDLSHISVYLNGGPAGEATPFVIGRHVHPAVPQALPPPTAPEERSGIDYMALVAKAEAVAQGEGSIDYRAAL